jgi:hypothetical protein
VGSWSSLEALALALALYGAACRNAAVAALGLAGGIYVALFPALLALPVRRRIQLAARAHHSTSFVRCMTDCESGLVVRQDRTRYVRWPRHGVRCDGGRPPRDGGGVLGASSILAHGLCGAVRRCVGIWVQARIGF